MAELFNEIKSDGLDHIYKGKAGSLRNWKGTWYTCRVEFHHYFDGEQERGINSDKYFFYHELPPIQQSLDVISEVEEILKVGSQVKAYKTNSPDSYCMQCGPWWQHPIRFTLLTILLRDAKKNLQKTLEATDTTYLRETPMANQRFFREGNINFQNKGYKGWVMQFKDKSKAEVDLMLTDQLPTFPEIFVEHHPGFGNRIHKQESQAAA